MIVFALLAALGLLISIAANVSTFFGVEPMHRWACIWLLHLGIFFVFIPAATIQSHHGNQRPFRWREVFGVLPAWMRWMSVCLIIYATVSAVAFGILCGSGGPSKEPDGTYAMSSHGRILRTLTADEYHRASGYEFRFMSSGWIMFYSISLVLLNFGGEPAKRRSPKSAGCGGPKRAESPGLNADLAASDDYSFLPRVRMGRRAGLDRDLYFAAVSGFPWPV